MSHQTVDKTVSGLPKGAVALGEALEKVVAAIKASQADGFQPLQDIPAVVSAAVMALVTSVKDLGDLPVEASEDVVGVAQAIAISGFAIAKTFQKAPAAPAAPQA